MNISNETTFGKVNLICIHMYMVQRPKNEIYVHLYVVIAFPLRMIDFSIIPSTKVANISANAMSKIHPADTTCTFFISLAIGLHYKS